MCGDARVLENLNAEDITMTEINGNQWTVSDFSKKHSIHSAVVLGHDQGASCIDCDVSKVGPPSWDMSMMTIRKHSNINQLFEQTDIELGLIRAESLSCPLF